jgi:two-component system phosphate regulon sensor histidine kinase PhoR
MDPLLILIIVLSVGLILLGVRAYRQAQALEMADAAASVLRRELTSQREQSRELVAELNALADVTLDAVMVVNQAHQIVVVNEAAREAFGQGQQGTLVGKTLLAVTRHHEIDELVDEVLKADEPLETQLILHERSYRVRGLVVALQNRPAVALAMQDVSEMVRLARARRDMVANIVHDLGTPLNSISLLVEKLTMKYGKNPDKDRQDLAKMTALADSLKHIVREMLDLSTIESGKAIIRMVDVKVADLVQSAVTLMATQAESKKQEIVNEIAPDLMVLADPEQTRRVLTNLLHNSIKFTSDQGQGKIRITAESYAPDMLKVSVIDNGRGIPPADRSRIFERFYQVDTARSGEKSAVGAGLGLSIAKHIVTSQGGQIWAEPNFPQGVCICFTLALTTDHAPASA